MQRPTHLWTASDLIGDQAPLIVASYAQTHWFHTWTPIGPLYMLVFKLRTPNWEPRPGYFLLPSAVMLMGLDDGELVTDGSDLDMCYTAVVLLGATFSSYSPAAVVHLGNALEAAEGQLIFWSPYPPHVHFAAAYNIPKQICSLLVGPSKFVERPPAVRMSDWRDRSQSITTICRKYLRHYAKTLGIEDLRLPPPARRIRRAG